MEIWIVGLIVVITMVYVSTKIKKQAKLAYEREVFQTEHFVIVKPADFIIPINEKSPYLFEAHSKDFGIEEARDLYECTATVSAESLPREDESKAGIAEDEIAFEEFEKKIVDLNSKKGYQLNIRVLTDSSEKYREKITEMLDSFSPRKL